MTKVSRGFVGALVAAAAGVAGVVACGQLLIIGERISVDGGVDLAVEDLRNDTATDGGARDAACTSAPRQSIALSPETTYPGGGKLGGGMAVGDVNGDGFDDVVIGSDVGYRTLLGDPVAPLSRVIDTPDAESIRLTLGDFDGDGILDLAACGGGSAPHVRVLRGSGDGHFAFATEVIATAPLEFLRAGDVDGDGQDDLVAGWAATMPGGLEMVVWLTHGHLPNPGLSFNAIYATPVGHAFYDAAVADLDHDGRADVSLSDQGPYKDLAIPDAGSLSESSVRVLYSNGGGALRNGSILATDGVRAFGIVARDLDGDGRIDLALGYGEGEFGTLGGGVAVYHNAGGSFLTLPMVKGQGTPLTLAAADFNSDGLLEVVGISLNIGTHTQALEVFPGTKTGLTAPVSIGMSNAYLLGAGRIDCDGYADIVVLHSGTPEVGLWRSMH